ncbi:MAG TPA: Hpt domain-containing protein [Polyangia bacterium]|nr:Hpt domain-containing protein [Polyangia bacterium]
MDDTLVPFEERMRGLRAGFVAGLPARLNAMRLAQRTEDRSTLQREAHRLSGTGLSYGFPQLTVWGREVEHRCKKGEPLTAIGRDLERLADMIAALIAEPLSTPIE